MHENGRRAGKKRGEAVGAGERREQKKGGMNRVKKSRNKVKIAGAPQREQQQESTKKQKWKRSRRG